MAAFGGGAGRATVVVDVEDVAFVDGPVSGLNSSGAAATAGPAVATAAGAVRDGVGDTLLDGGVRSREAFVWVTAGRYTWRGSAGGATGGAFSAWWVRARDACDLG